MKTLQWNIGGGRIRKETDDSVLGESYKTEDLVYISSIISKFDPDIITLQEVHSNEYGSQAEEIAKALGIKNFNVDIYADSHLEEGQKLSQAIISKFPIESSDFHLLFNPKYEVTRPDGEKMISHDKGISIANIILPNNEQVQIMTLHMIPFRTFKVDLNSDSVKKILEDLIDKVRGVGALSVFQGDFNIDQPSLKDAVPGIFDLGFGEVLLDSPTTPEERMYDHVLYKGLKHIKSEVIPALTDHFPVYSEFELV